MPLGIRRFKKIKNAPIDTREMIAKSRDVHPRSKTMRLISESELDEITQTTNSSTAEMGSNGNSFRWFFMALQ